MLTKKDKKLATADSIKMEARNGIRSLALPIMPGETIKAQWRKISRRTGFTARRVRTLWYGQAESVKGHEIEIIRKLATAQTCVEEAQENTKDLRTEIAELRERLDRILSIIGDGQNERA